MSAGESKRFLTRSGLLLLLVTCQCVSFTPASNAADKARELTSAELVESLRAAKVIDPTYSLSATRIGDLELITTERNPKLDDKATKVQAVLIAKAAFDLLPTGVQRNKLIFHDMHSGMFSEVIVNRTEITSYGKGEIDEKTLLASLELEKKSGDDAPPVTTQAVADGPLKPERMLQLSNIEFLKSKGANLNKVEDMFAAQEKEAEAGHLPAVQKSIRQIWDILNEQRSMLKSAQAAANGNGVGKASAVASGGAGAGGALITSMMLGPLMKFLGTKGVDVSHEKVSIDKLNSLPQGDPRRKNARLSVLRSLQTKFENLPKSTRDEYYAGLQSKFRGINSNNKSEVQDSGVNLKHRTSGKSWRSPYQDPNATR